MVTAILKCGPRIYTNCPVMNDPLGDSNHTLESLSTFHSSSTDFKTSSGIGREWSVQAAFVEGSNLWALLVTGYVIVLCVGVVGNIFLLAALCGSGSRSRSLPVRNHLMVNLAAADLLVTAFCVPISACAAASHACWPSFMVSWMCQIGPLLQKTPVAASTLSLALLSLDRWAALRHPRFAQRFREKRFVALSMISIWILASVVSAPTLWARQWEAGFPDVSNSSGQQENFAETESVRNTSSIWQWEWSGLCVERWTTDELQIAYVTTYLGTAFVSPAFVVAFCHASVSQKLTAQLRVLANSTVGERVRRKPQHVIILARDPDPNSVQVETSKPSRKIVPCDPNSDEDDVFVQMQIKADLESFRDISQHQQGTSQRRTRGRSPSQLKSYPSLRQNYGRGKAGSSTTSRPNFISQKPLRAAKNEASIIRAHRRAHRKSLVTQRVLTKQPLLQTYSSQSFRSRRRAAKLMAALAAVFVFCWAPYVICALWDIFTSDKSIVQLIIPFALFMGHAHSAINPVVSWRLNRSAFVRFKRQPLLSFLPDWTPLRRLTCGSITSMGRNCLSCFSTCAGEKPEVPDRNAADSTRRWQNQDHSVTAINHNRDKCSCRYICCSCCSTLFLNSCCQGRRRPSLSDEWNGNTSTNEAALGAFHPKYLSRRPVPDPVSNCHTSHFLK